MPIPLHDHGHGLSNFHRVEGEGVYLVSEKGVTVIEGALAAELAQRSHDLAVATAETRQQTDAADQARADASAAEVLRIAAEARGDALARDLAAVTRSFRTFWRHYWPNFQRHWLGR